MSQWYIELTSKDEVLLMYLTTCLHEPSCTVIQNNGERFYIVERDSELLYRTSDLLENQNNRYYWLSSDFDVYTEAYDALYYAREQLPLLNSIIKLKCGMRISSIKIEDVYRIDEQGRFIKETAVIPPVEGRIVTSEKSLQAALGISPTIIETWQAARSNPKVEEAIRNYANPHAWFNLVKVFEIIAEDAGKSENSGKLRKGTFDKWTQGRDYGKNPPGRSFDFLQTAHSYYWSGLSARHSSAESRRRAGVNPMSLQEASEYITDLLLKWLQSNP